MRRILKVRRVARRKEVRQLRNRLADIGDHQAHDAALFGKVRSRSCGDLGRRQGKELGLIGHGLQSLPAFVTGNAAQHPSQWRRCKALRQFHTGDLPSRVRVGFPAQDCERLFQFRDRHALCRDGGKCHGDQSEHECDCSSHTVSSLSLTHFDTPRVRIGPTAFPQRVARPTREDLGGA